MSSTKDHPILSVIVPTFRRPAMLGKCLKCLCEQRFDHGKYEVIVVDNVGDEETKEIVNSLTVKGMQDIRFIVEKRRGLHYARHAGAEVALGDLLLFTDDDILGPHLWLQGIVSSYREEKVVAVGGPISIEWDKAPPAWVREHEWVLGQLDHGREWRVLNSREFINGGNFSIRKRYLFEVGGFNPDQVDQILIGDGETGLCNKIHARGDLIAWCPFPHVQHQQIAHKNGTLHDLRRRYANNGICAAYQFAIKEKINHLMIVKRLRRCVPSWSKCNALLICLKIRKGFSNTSEWHKISLQEAYLRAEIIYLFRCLFDPRIKSVVRRLKWYK